MKKISSVVTQFDSASTGFSEGKLRDNPGDNTGSSVVAAIDNDAYYARLAVIKKYRPSGISDTPESELNSDFLEGMEHAMEMRVDGVAEWSAATTYSTINTPVMRYGLQFVNINTTSNLNKDPLLEPLYWLAVPDFRSILADYSTGRIVPGGSHQMHDFNHANYRQFFSLGLHKPGGASGPAYQAWAVHIDGSAVGSGALSDIVEAWYLKDDFAPGSIGARTLRDAKGRLLRAIDATGGQAATMGAVLADQMQGHVHQYAPYPVSGAGPGFGPGLGGGYPTGIATLGPSADGTNGTPRTGLFTRDKSITVGVPYAVIVLPV